MSRVRPGDRVRVTGHVNVSGEDEAGHHGDEGRVMRVQNPRHRKPDGTVVVPVQLESGEVIVVPERALEKQTKDYSHG